MSTPASANRPSAIAVRRAVELTPSLIASMIVRRSAKSAGALADADRDCRRCPLSVAVQSLGNIMKLKPARSSFHLYQPPFRSPSMLSWPTARYILSCAGMWYLSIRSVMESYVLIAAPATASWSARMKLATGQRSRASSNSSSSSARRSAVEMYSSLTDALLYAEFTGT